MKLAIFLLFVVAAAMADPMADPMAGSEKTTAKVPVEECPKINGVYVTLIPNPADCTTYYACETGTPILMHCPAGLHFSPTLYVCDLPIHAQCEKP